MMLCAINGRNPELKQWQNIFFFGLLNCTMGKQLCYKKLTKNDTVSMLIFGRIVVQALATLLTPLKIVQTL